MTKKILLLASLIFWLFCEKVVAQDTIIKSSNEVIIAKVIEVNSTEIKYKRFDLPDGPTYIVSKSSLYRIKYNNGTSEQYSNLPQKTEEVKSVQNSPTDTLRNYILTTKDGTKLKGKIISQNEKEVVFLDNNFGERKIKRSSINNISLENGENAYVFKLKDGSVITGKIINKTDEKYVVETQHLGVIEILSNKISSVTELREATITEKGSIWFQNPNSTRYLIAPSAFQLKKGEGYYQNIYGGGNAWQFGLHKNVTLGGGLVGPMGAYLNLKVGGKLFKYVHVSGGVILGNSFFPIGGSTFGGGLGFGVVTIGNYDHNVTFGAGYGMVNRLGTIETMEKPLYVANGTARLGKKYSLVTENWIVNVQGDPFGRGFGSGTSHYETFFSYAFRYMGENSTLDAGFINTPALIEKGWYIGIPYIGFVVRFGKYKDE